MRKALCLVDSHLDIKGKLDEIGDLASELADRVDFLHRQAKQADEKRGAIWKDIDGMLFDKGLLPPEYQPDKHNLRYDKEGGVLFWEDKQTDSDLGRKLAELLLSGLLKDK